MSQHDRDDVNDAPPTPEGAPSPTTSQGTNDTSAVDLAKVKDEDMADKMGAAYLHAAERAREDEERGLDGTNQEHEGNLPGAAV
jgi:hypothetical protein